MARTKRPKIMNSYIHVKIPQNEKEDFIAKLQAKGATISNVIRQMIKEYLERP